MTNKKILMLLVITVFILVVTLIGCSGNSLSGTYKNTWPSNPKSFTFNKNGTGTYSWNGAPQNFTYKIKGTIVEIFDTTAGRIVYELEITGKDLKIQDEGYWEKQ